MCVSVYIFLFFTLHVLSIHCAVREVGAGKVASCKCVRDYGWSVRGLTRTDVYALSASTHLHSHTDTGEWAPALQIDADSANFAIPVRRIH